MTALASLVRRAIAALSLLVAFSWAAEARVYPVEAIRPGLRGTAKTVVRGTDVESFEVEFLGIMRNAGPAGDLILIRATGDVIERTGGIAAGMSGSPVYIDDQLVGAISYGYSMADHRIGLVTPFQDMLEVLNMIEPTEADTEVPSNPSSGTDATPLGAPLAGGFPAIDGTPIHSVVLAETITEAESLAAAASPGTFVFAPMRAPLLAAGLSHRAVTHLGERLAGYELVPVQIAGDASSTEHADATLEPGSAFGVQLIRGDVSLTSIGTVTYVDGDRFVGFGHSFLDRGPVDYVAGSAYIHYVVQSLSSPFKLGSVTAPVGSLLQDRAAGVAGRLGETPRMIPVSISVYDMDRDVQRTTNFEIVADETYLVDLVTSGALAALDRSIDRLGRGTARVVFQLDGAGMPRPLVRDNLYYSDRDIAALSLLEFVEAVSLVVNNRFSPVDLERIQLTAHIEQQRWTAHIESATPDKEEVRPGETVHIEVQLRPYRSEPLRQVISLTVPHDALPGFVTVEVRGGGWGLRPPSTEEDTIVDDPEEFLGIVSDLERLIDEFVRRERNNEIVAEFFGRRDERQGAAAPAEAEESGAPSDSGWRERFAGGGWVVATRPTPYVVLGTQYFDLYIAAPADSASGPAAEPADESSDEIELPDDVGMADDVETVDDAEPSGDASSPSTGDV